MSLIIKGMEMPEQLPDLTNTNALTEYNCQIFIDSKGNASLRIRGHKEEYPIVKLSAAHGRLIDADKAATTISMMNNHPCGNSIETVNDVVEWLRFEDENGNNIAFPTIIEAEVSE